MSKTVLVEKKEEEVTTTPKQEVVPKGRRRAVVGTIGEDGQEIQQLEEVIPQKIQKAKIVFHGLRPLLMSSPRELLEKGDEGNTRKSSDEYDDKEEAEKRAYRDGQRFLVVPQRCIRACLIKASKLYRMKQKGFSFSDMIKGSLFITPENIRIKNSRGQFIKNYEISRELVVVKKSRIKRCRPQIDDWTLEFEAVWDPRLYGLKAKDLEKAVQDAGHIGLLDWRPTYGTFEVKSFQVTTK